MKKNVELMSLGHRTKAIAYENDLPKVVKVVPIKYQALVQKLGFIDVRSKKLTLTMEERLLLLIHTFSSKLKVYYTGFQVDEIQIESKSRIKFRDKEDIQYVVRIKDATEIAIPLSYYRKLNVPEINVNRL